MNLPPRFTAFAGQTLDDTTIVVPVYVVQGALFSVTVSASDPESDPVTFGASYLRQDLGMSFGGNTFSWTPPASAVGQTFNVKFSATTPSGGTDSFLAELTVHQTAPQFKAVNMGHKPLRVLGANPVQGAITVEGDFAATGVRFEVYDMQGRRVAAVSRESGTSLSWDPRGPNGHRIANGLYMYRVTAGRDRLQGKLVIAR